MGRYDSLEEGIVGIQRGDEAVEIFNSITKMGDVGAKQVAAVLKKNRTLKLLDLCENSIGPEGAGSLADALKTNSSLTSLDLRSNQVGAAGASSLAGALKVNTFLTLLDLQWNGIGPDGAGSLAEALEVNSSLTVLSLNGNNIGPEGAGSLAKALKVNSSLTLLDLLWDDIGPVGAGSLAEVLKVNSSLAQLTLSGNNIGPEGAGSLAKALKVNSSLTLLDLWDNKIGQGAVLLVEGLEVNTSLTSLNLRGNGIGDKGAGGLAETLKVKASLTHLDLRENDIGPEGAVSLGEALKVNTSLTTLNLYYNNIGSEGADSLADALKVNSSLTLLDISYNGIAKQGAGSLAEALIFNSSLTTLGLSGAVMSWNKIGDQGAGSLAEALKVNSSLTSLDLGYNKIGEKGGQALADAIEYAARNNTLALTEIRLEGNDIPISIEKRIEKYVNLRKHENEFAYIGQKALKEDVLAPWGRVKLMFVGKGAAGKTSTVRSLLGEKFVKTQGSTIGMDLTTMTAVSADEKFEKGERKPLSEALAKHKGLSQRESYDLRKHMRQVSNRRAPAETPKTGPAEKTLVETVKEVRPKAFKVERGDVMRQYDGELIARFEGKSTKGAQELSFSLWDYGGQEVFYALHHLFLTHYGLYVVVFDMQEALADDTNCISFLRFWIKSIALHAPGAPFILVGTRMDIVRDAQQHAQIHDLLEEGLRLNECDGLVANAQDELCYFPVDNKTDKRSLLEKAMRRKKKDRVPALRQAIVATCFKQEYVDKPVRLRWLLVLEKLDNDSSRSFWLLQEVEKLCEEHDVEDCLEMLAYFNELGVLVHLTATEELRHYVVIRPQWLLDGITLIIRDKEIHMDKEWKRKLKTSADFDSRLAKDVDAWVEKGLVSRALVDFLVDRFGAENGWSEKDVDYLLEVMRNMQLASVWETQNQADVFVVPSLLPRAPESWLSSDCVRFHQDNSSMCWIQFDFLPMGLFTRFLSSMVRHFGNLRYKTRVERVYLDHALVVFNEECSFLVSVDGPKDRVIARFDSECEENVPTIVRLLSEEFAVLSNTFMHGKLKTEIVLSANGTDSEDACVPYASFKKVQQDGKKKCESLKKGTFVKLEALSIFQSTISLTLSSSSEAQEFDVFLSHNWGDDAHGRDNHKRVEEIAKKLRDRGLRVFLDSWELRGNVDEAMTSGIDRSRVFLVCVTQKYMDKVNSNRNSDNCWAEFEYAVTKEKQPLPVVMEKGIGNQSKWGGKFLFRTGKQLYVDLSEDDAIQQEEKMNELFSMIESHKNM